MKLTLFVLCSLVALTRADLGASPIEQEISNFQGRTLDLTATVGQLPWHVWVRSAVGTSSITCGGTLIAGNWVLTAAHCVHGYNTFTIGVGSNNINAPVIQMISTIAIVNPSFDATTLKNDLALIQLPTSLNSYDKLVRLPARSLAAATFVNFVGIVSGLRRLNEYTTALSSFLSVVNMRVMTNAACVNGSGHGDAFFTGNVLCASPVTPVQPGFGACLGDSGGPMVIWTSNIVPTLIGVISFNSGRGCGVGNPTVFASVARFLTWINAITGIPLRDV